jgi:FixJ family two-component response regulator
MPIHIIDDESTITDFIADVLRFHSDHIACFHSAEEYLTHMNSDCYIEPRLIITDVRMGGMNGFELIKTLRATGLKAKIIVMSGFCGYSIFSEQYFDGFLEKPFDIMRLQSMVSQLLSNAIPLSGYQKASVPASKANRPSK